MKTLIKNARIISPGIDLPGAAVEIEGKTITCLLYTSHIRLEQGTEEKRGER